MGVQGFPTLKIVRPSKKPGKPVVEDYQGPRESKDIIEAVKNAIPNNVKRVADKTLTLWLEKDNGTAKALLFSDKGVTSALTKVLANEFIGSLLVGQVRNKEAATNEMFGVTEYPTLVVIPGGTKESIVYDGAFTKAAMKDFLSKHASPTEGSTLKDKVKDKIKGTADQVKEKAQKVMGEDKDPDAAKPAESEEAAFSSASSSHKASEASPEEPSATAETLEEDSNPTESPEPAVTPDSKPIILGSQPEPIPTLDSQNDLLTKCLGEKTHTCVLALLPALPEGGDETLSEPATIALASLAEVAEKHKERKGNLFPFFAVPSTNAATDFLRDALKLGGEKELELVAVNGRRGWFRRFETGKFDSLSVETWIDNIRFGEGSKGKLPEYLLGLEGMMFEDVATGPADHQEGGANAQSEEKMGDTPKHEEL